MSLSLVELKQLNSSRLIQVLSYLEHHTDNRRR